MDGFSVHRDNIHNFADTWKGKELWLNISFHGSISLYNNNWNEEEGYEMEVEKDSLSEKIGWESSAN